MRGTQGPEEPDTEAHPCARGDDDITRAYAADELYLPLSAAGNDAIFEIFRAIGERMKKRIRKTGLVNSLTNFVEPLPPRSRFLPMVPEISPWII